MRGDRQTNVDDFVRKTRLKKLLKRDVHYNTPIRIYSGREGGDLNFEIPWRKLIGVFMRALCNTRGEGDKTFGLRKERRGGEQEGPSRVASAN